MIRRQWKHPGLRWHHHPEDHAELQRAHAEASRAVESEDSPEAQSLEAQPRSSQPNTTRPPGAATGPARRRRQRPWWTGTKPWGFRSSGLASGSIERVHSGADQAAIPDASPRPSKGVVILAIGLPGSGKSSWFKRNKITPFRVICCERCCSTMPNEQRFQDLVFSNLRSMLKARLIARRPTNYLDATNLTPHERQGWIKLAKDYGYEVQAVFFDVPVEVCLERNQKRERVVAEDVMRRMAGKLKAPSFEEGFGKITVVRVKAKE